VAASTERGEKTADVAWFSAGEFVVRQFDRRDLVMVEPARPQIAPWAFLAQGAIVRGDVRVARRGPSVST
jgi:hypothetical protein